MAIENIFAIVFGVFIVVLFLVITVDAAWQVVRRKLSVTGCVLCCGVTVPMPHCPECGRKLR